MRLGPSQLLLLIESLLEEGNPWDKINKLIDENWNDLS